MKALINYIISFFTKHDLEYYPKYMEQIAERGKLITMVDQYKKELDEKERVIFNLTLKDNYHKNAIFVMKSKSNKELAKLEEDNARLQRTITEQLNRINNLEKKLNRMPETISDLAKLRLR
jgi:hypothetical protein